MGKGGSHGAVPSGSCVFVCGETFAISAKEYTDQSACFEQDVAARSPGCRRCNERSERTAQPSGVVGGDCSVAIDPDVDADLARYIPVA